MQLSTTFPAETRALNRQCEFLANMAAERRAELVTPLAQITVPHQLEHTDWVNNPASFISSLSAWLWSSGQIDRFREGSAALFAALPSPEDHPHRLTIVVLGRQAPLSTVPPLQKLSRRGVLLTRLQTEQMPEQIFAAFRLHANASSEPYAHWYVDGGEPWNEPYSSISGSVAVSYPQLDPLRQRTLAGMKRVTETMNAGAESMRSDLAAMSPGELHAGEIISDPVLQRFYTELFTESSGPQIFSTSFVQWAGRELARRAQPQTLLLRYAPRQRYRPFNELLGLQEPDSTDPEGSLRDAEIGAWYTWIEMNRITSPGKGSFVAWIEGTAQAVVVGSGAPAGTVCDSPLTLQNALASFA